MSAGSYDFTLQLDFVDSLGDLDLYLYDYNGAQIASSMTTSDDEEISGVLNVPSSRWCYFGVKLWGSASTYPVYYNLGYLATPRSSAKLKDDAISCEVSSDQELNGEFISFQPVVDEEKE